MTFLRLPSVPRRPPARDLFDSARHQFYGRRGLLIVAVGVLVTGVAANWSWLMAVGLAPLLLGVLPCLAMCGLGLCMNRLAGRSCAGEHSPSTTPGGMPAAHGISVQLVAGETPSLDGVVTEAQAVTTAVPETTGVPQPLQTRSPSNA